MRDVAGGIVQIDVFGKSVVVIQYREEDLMNVFKIITVKALNVVGIDFRIESEGISC